MVSYRRLLERLVVLSPSFPAAGAHRGLARDLAGAILKPIEQKPLALPGRGDCPWWPQAFEDAEQITPGFGASALKHLVLDSVRVYERRAVEGQRALSFIGSVETADVRRALHAVLEVPVRAGRPIGYGTFHLEAADLDDAELVRELLTSVARELRPGSMYHDPDGPSHSALFVGELSTEEQATLRSDLWARGINLKPYLGEPQRRPTATEDAIRGFDGEVALFATQRCGRSQGKVRGLLDARAPQTIVELAESTVEQLRFEWCLQLDDLGLDEVQEAEPAEPVVAQERTWMDVKETVEGLWNEQQGDDSRPPSFCLCPKAWSHLERNSFIYPGRMEESLVKLARLGSMWAAVFGKVGDFETWARQEEDLIVVMKDAGLRVHARAAIKCEFDGEEYMAEAHVKLQASAKWVPPNENGRIYFALDSKHWRFIVHHIGLKLA